MQTEEEVTKPSFNPDAQTLFPRSQLIRRSRMETYCDILKAIGSGARRPTHILHRANLSWNVLQKCLDALETQKLIIATRDDHDDERSAKTTYQLSDQGYSLLNQFMSIKCDLKLATDE